jgi:hypothetical protein
MWGRPKVACDLLLRHYLGARPFGTSLRLHYFAERVFERLLARRGGGWGKRRRVRKMA